MCHYNFLSKQKKNILIIICLIHRTICAIVAQRQQGNLENFTNQCLLRTLPPIFAVFSDNAEFGLIENCFQWMPPKLFDVSNRLLWLFQRVTVDAPDLFTKQTLPFPHETVS
jgi:hypothetical protein